MTSDNHGNSSTIAPPHGELCQARALGCGPCQLVKDHRPEHRHLCDHYAKGGVELHDPADRYCRCPACEEDRLREDERRAFDAMRAATNRHVDAADALRQHWERFGTSHGKIPQGEPE